MTRELFVGQPIGIRGGVCWMHDGRTYAAVLTDSAGTDVDEVQVVVWDGNWQWCGGADGPVVSALRELRDWKTADMEARLGL